MIRQYSYIMVGNKKYDFALIFWEFINIHEYANEIIFILAH